MMYDEKKNRLIINEFLNFLKFEKGNSDKTIESYKRDLNLFFEHMVKNYDDIVSQEIIEYIGFISSKLKRNSVLRKISAIKSFYKFCYLNKHVKSDPTTLIKNMKRESRLPAILTMNEIKDIINNCKSTPIGVMDRLIIKLLVATGARISEILNLEIKDIENQNYEFIKVLGKGSKYRIIPIYDGLENEIKNYIDCERKQLKHNDTNKLFPGTRRENFWKRLKKIASDTEIKKNVYPHIFRHSVATELLSNGADIRVVQEILGHVSINTTEIYTHVEKTKLKNIYEKIRIGDEDE